MSRSLLASRKNKSVYAIAWITWSMVHFTILMYLGSSWRHAATDALISNSLLAGAALLIVNSLRFYRPVRNQPFYILILCLSISGVWLLAANFALESLTPDQRFVDNSLPVRLSIAFLINGFTAMLSLFWYQIEEQQEQLQVKAETEAIAKDAELYSLSQQLQPHFLFNSLNSISALVGSDHKLARNMINQLSTFLRGTVQQDDRVRIKIEEELEHLTLYLDIEKIRFGHRLEASIHVEAPGAMIPPMILQPIVENAIKFGLYDTIGQVTIRIHATLADDHLLITVTNPFDPETSAPVKGTGFGLSSVKRRLFLIFSRSDLLSTSHHMNTFTTTIKIPQQQAKHRTIINQSLNNNPKIQ